MSRAIKRRTEIREGREGEERKGRDMLIWGKGCLWHDEVILLEMQFLMKILKAY